MDWGLDLGGNCVPMTIRGTGWIKIMDTQTIIDIVEKALDSNTVDTGCEHCDYVSPTLTEGIVGVDKREFLVELLYLLQEEEAMEGRMAKKVYYTVNKEIDDSNDSVWLTGYKEVGVYEINARGSELRTILVDSIDLSENTEEYIREVLAESENPEEYEGCELILL